MTTCACYTDEWGHFFQCFDHWFRAFCLKHLYTHICTNDNIDHQFPQQPHIY